MQLHQLKRNSANKKARRVGRGGKRGKTSGRGGKGQTARAGHKVRPEMRDIIKKLPKRRGHGKNRARTVNSGRVNPVVVNVGALSGFDGSTTITPTLLLEKGLIHRIGGQVPPVKILGNGSVTQKLTIEDCTFSKEAQKKIESAGGTIGGKK